MLQTDIAALSVTHLSGLGLSPESRPERYSFADTVKNTLTSAAVPKTVVILSSNTLELTLAKNDYLFSLLTELHFGVTRIAEQCRALQSLVEKNAQSAWTLVTAYYACYFIANDLAKCAGRFIINFSPDDLSDIVTGLPPSQSNLIQLDGPTPFMALVSHGEMSGEVTLSLRKSSPKPHKLAWSNFQQILNAIRINDARAKHLDLLKNIAGAQNGWNSPSDIRNAWNYSQANYYGPKGDDLAKTFNSAIRSNKSAYGWAGNNNIKPTPENIPTSIAYLFHTLKAAHDLLIQRLCLCS
jgi:hypothetical protein